MKILTQKFKINVLVFVFFLGLAMALTYPLVSHFGSFIPGREGDAFVFIWNHWWVPHALFSGHNPYFTNLLAYPIAKVNLSLHSLTFTNALLFFPFQLVFGLVAGFNAFFILSLALAAYGMYLLLDYIFKNKYAAVIGGVMITFNSYMFYKMAGHFNYTSIYIIPFYVLFFLKMISGGRRKHAIASGMLLAVSFYNDFYYTIGLLFFSAGAILWLGLREKKVLLARVKHFLLCFFVWLAISAPLLYYALTASWSGNYPFPQLGQVNLYTPDLRSFFIPSRFHTIWGNNFYNYYSSLRLHSSVVYLSFILLVLGIIGYFLGGGRNKKKSIPLFNFSSFWLLQAIIFLFVCLGPFVFLNGYIFSRGGILFTIPLPGLLLSFVPFVRGILVPPRFIIFVLFCLVVLAGFALKGIFVWLGKRLLVKIFLAGLIIGLFLFENNSTPIFISDARIPNFYHQLKKDKKDYAVLELPFALSTSFYTLGSVAHSSKLQYYQSVHHKRLLGGYISRVPDEYYRFYQKIVGLDYLINPQKPKSDSEIAAIKNQVKDNFLRLNIKYVIIHPEYYRHRQLRHTVDFLNKVFGQAPTNQDNLLVYRL